MIQWRLIGVGPRPVPEPVHTSVTWLAAAVCAPTVIAAHNLLDDQGDPWLDLVALSALCAVLGLSARLTAAPGTALVCWAFFSLFALPPLGRFSWAVQDDWKRLGLLLLAAGVGTLYARLRHARAAYCRLSSMTQPQWSRPAPRL
ncbi:hypothetical protein [Streptomyces peucetius]|uniref:Histidine kinase n=1 Tax=Streptomyces peucetius TaxID=1950 RepID=A0ABY6I849_STRPE|nr:hypothetical protein [Streptomyces peucetius]UYQ63153.1 hypothetical protein OGH68_17875 [Streptomyces peucetius]